MIPITPIVDIHKKPIHKKPITRHRTHTPISPQSYKEYARDISRFIPTIKENIRNSKTGLIRIKDTDMIKALGKNYQYRSITTLWVALKVVLYSEGIILSVENMRKPDDRSFIMRFGNERDILSPSLLERFENLIKD